MVSCSVINCKNQSGRKKERKIRFFGFPKNIEYKEKWLKICSPTTNSDIARVCSDHFQPSDYVPNFYKTWLPNYSPKNNRRLKKDAVPSLKETFVLENNLDATKYVLFDGTSVTSKTNSLQEENSAVKSTNSNEYQKSPTSAAESSETSKLDDNIQDLDIQNFEKLKQEYLKTVQRCQKLEQENKQNLKAYIKDTSRLKKQVKRLQSERHFEEKCVQRLQHIFTGNQADKLLQNLVMTSK